MDVTFSPVAGASLRPDGPSEEGLGATDPSFDLFLDLNEAVVPNLDPVEPREDHSLTDREALKRVTGRDKHDPHRAQDPDDVERATRTERDADSRRIKREASLETTSDKSEVSKETTSEIAGRTRAADDRKLDSKERVDSPEDSEVEDSLAGAQGATGASEKLDDSKRQAQLNLRQIIEPDKALDRSAEQDFQEEQATQTIEMKEASSEVLNEMVDGQFQHDPTVTQTVTTEQSTDLLSESKLAETEKNISTRFGQLTQLPNQASGDDTTLLDTEMTKPFTAQVDTAESRFADADLQTSSSQSNQVQNSNNDANDTDLFFEGDPIDAEWSRLLNQDTPTEKLARTTGIRTSDSVQLSSAGTKAGAESGAGRGLATGPGAITQPTKAAAVAAAKQAQAPTQGQLPEGVDEMSILRQISDGLRLKNGRLQRAEIRLNPQELGTIRINMEMKGDAVRLIVSAEHAAVGELLSNGLEQLRKELLAQGMHVEHVEVRSELHGEGSQKDDSEREQGEGAERDVNEVPVTHSSQRHHHGQISVRA